MFRLLLCELFQSRCLVLFILLLTLISAPNFYLEYFTFILLSSLFLLLFSNVLNWNRIISFAPSLSSSSPSQLPPQTLLITPHCQVGSFFFFEYFVTNTYIEPTKSVFVVCMYIVSWLNTLHWTSIKVAHDWEGLILLPPAVNGHLQFFI